MERFARLIHPVLKKAIQSRHPTEDLPLELELPPDPKMGDFAFPCFRLGKTLRKAPPVIAQELAAEAQKELASAGLQDRLTVAAVGPYVNFTVAPEEASFHLLNDILTTPGQWGTYGSYPASAEGRGTWVLEFSSPNVAKPLNIYHLRPTALGAALDRVGRFRGLNVISINHLGDWGKQYGLLAIAFRHFKRSVTDSITMSELVDLYVRINAELEKHPELEDQAREAFLKLEKGDPEITRLWEKCVKISIEQFNKQYQRLNVRFDHVWGESFYKNELDPLLNELRSKGLLVESEGAWVVPVTDEKGQELPPCILQKQDGATIYATRDVAAAIYRQKQFGFDRMTYIVGAEQKLHFKQVFGVLRKMGHPWVERCEHIPFGLYRFKDAKMSTRKGNFITLDAVLEEAKTQVRELVRTRVQTHNLEFSPEQLEATSEAVAIGAVVFHDLRVDPVRDVEFDIQRAIDFEGETGPYLQYAHTRCLSILRKASQDEALSSQLKFGDKSIEKHIEKAARLINEPAEVQLVKTLGQFPIHLERTLTFAKASQLANYLIDLTKNFGTFYRECQVLGQDPAITQARLMLVEATRRVLGRGLSLMGIPLPEKM